MLNKNDQRIKKKTNGQDGAYNLKVLYHSSFSVIRQMGFNKSMSTLPGFDRKDEL